MFWGFVGCRVEDLVLSLEGSEFSDLPIVPIVVPFFGEPTSIL